MGVAKRVRIGEDSLRALSRITEGIMTGDNSDTVGLSTLPADEGDRTLTPVVLLVRVHPLECVEASQNDIVNDLGTLVKSVVLFAKIGLQLAKEKGLSAGGYSIQADNSWVRGIWSMSFRRSLARQVVRS